MSNRPTKTYLISYQNVRGLRTKTDRIYAHCRVTEAHIINFTETWLDDGIESPELFDSSFAVFRSDRKFSSVGRSRGGGVLSAVSESIVAELVDVAMVSGLVPLVDINVYKCFFTAVPTYMVNIYIPPDVNCDDFEMLLDALALVLVNKQTIIVGDFNATEFNIANSGDRKSLSIGHFMAALGLRQINEIVNSNNRLLDLVFTNLNCCVEVSRDSAPFVPEDVHHPALSLLLWVGSPPKARNFAMNDNMRYNFRAANLASLYSSFMEADWSYLTGFSDANGAVEAFYGGLYSLIDRYVPKFRSTGRQYPEWFTANIKRLIHLKEFYYRRWRSTRSTYYLGEFNRLRRLVKSESHNAYVAYQRGIESRIITDPKSFWRFVKNRRSASRIPGKMHYNGADLDQPLDIVNGFAMEFSRVFGADLVLPAVGLGGRPSFGVGAVSESDVVSSAARLKSDFTSGDDGVPSFLVRDCASALSFPLQLLFNLIITTSTFPDVWKVSKLIPVFKKGDRSDIKNYRPISVLSNFSKIFEHILYTRIYSSIKSALSVHQHGFMSGRSTVTNLVEIAQFLSVAVDRRKQVDVIYTDFSKAFDSINHCLLLAKLDRFGCSAPLIQLLSSYLSGRAGYTFYNGYSSKAFSITSGVPQGSNLGPLLFNVFIDDLLERLNCGVLGYADDLKIYSLIDDPADSVRLQINLTLIKEWCDMNLICLNVDKCCVVSYTRVSNPYVYCYVSGSAAIIRKSGVVDLGVFFDAKLTFAGHVSAICASASRSYGFLVRSCRNFKNMNCLKVLYYALVRTKLEYASMVWYPYYVHQQISLERVQRRFLKYLTFKSTGVYPGHEVDYSSLLVQHGIQSLSCRRERYSARFLLDLLTNRIDSPSLLSQIYFNVPARMTRNHTLINTPRARTNILIKSPIGHMSVNLNKFFPDVF